MGVGLLPVQTMVVIPGINQKYMVSHDRGKKSNLQIGYLSLDKKNLKMQFVILKIAGIQYRLKEMNFAV